MCFKFKLHVLVATILLLPLASAAAADSSGMHVCDGGVAYVDYEQITSANSRLTIGCIAGGKQQTVYAFTAASTCTSENRTFETMRAWKATAEAALLSARPLHIYFNTCESTDHISAVSLRAQ